MTPRKKPLIYGPDGRPLVRVNDRLAPKPRASAGLEGWVSWGLIDRNGREVQGGEQHNLILDSFLDFVAENTLQLGAFGDFRLTLTHFAVGTGSTPPNVADTALDAQVGARTTTETEYSSTQQSPGVHRFTLEREFDFSQGNGNLTEFGFAAGAASDILVRELFRDGAGNPITITKTSDYKLRIKYTLDVTLTPLLSSPAAHSFSVAGVGALSTVVGVSTHFLNAFSMFTRAGTRDSNRIGGVFVTSNDALSYTTPPTGSNGQHGSLTYDSYIPGSFERTADVVFGTALGNHQISTILIGGNWAGQNVSAGLACVIDAGDRFTKDNLHTLTFNEVFTVSWGRA